MSRSLALMAFLILVLQLLCEHPQYADSFAPAVVDGTEDDRLIITFYDSVSVTVHETSCYCFPPNTYVHLNML